MQYSPYLVALILVLAIVPAMTVAVIVWLRIETLRGDWRIAQREAKSSVLEQQALKEQIAGLDARFLSVVQDANRATLKVAGLEESFTYLSNKLNARERQEQLVKRRKEREALDHILPGTNDDEPENVGADVVPLFPPQQQPSSIAPQTASNRPFGRLK
jgi:hypothetical protein